MPMIEINDWKNKPAIAQLVRAVYPNYRKKSVKLWLRDTIELQNLGWDGGSKYEYHSLTQDGFLVNHGGAKNEHGDMPCLQGFPEGTSMKIPPGFVVVQGGTFLGKTAMVYIYVNPTDIGRYQ